MTPLARIVLCASLFSGFAVGCGDDADDDEEAGTSSLTAPSNLEASTVSGKPHLTWSDGDGEEHYMVERMDHAAGSDWAVVKDAESLVPNTNQFHDVTAQAGTMYMYRVVAMKGDSRAVSNEVTWP